MNVMKLKANPAKSMFVSSDRTWLATARGEALTSANACLSSVPMDLSPVTAVTSANTGPGAPTC